nr:TlpA disulfide reductase family protein [Cohnella hashimotonis]
MAPDFSLEGLDGATHSLSDYRGKLVVLNFWASWCGPCREEASALVKTAAHYKDKATVVAVNLTASDDESSARSFATDQHFAFPVLLDRLGTVGELYRIRPIPTTLFIDARGVVADEALGALGEDEFARRIEALLAPTGRG